MSDNDGEKPTAVKFILIVAAVIFIWFVAFNPIGGNLLGITHLERAQWNCDISSDPQFDEFSKSCGNAKTESIFLSVLGLSLALNNLYLAFIYSPASKSRDYESNEMGNESEKQSNESEKQSLYTSKFDFNDGKEYVLKVENLRKEFGGLVAVKDVSFGVGPGEFIGLIGPNGCGKSTTFNCISGLLQQTSGKVAIFGEDASDMRPDEIQNLGFTRTFQHTRLWRQMTVIENLLVPPRQQFKPKPLEAILLPFTRPAEEARLARAYEVLDQLEVPHMAHNLASELSGGQSKLVDIGRSMMGDPQLLLLDEPVAGVAGPLALKIFNNLRKIVDETGISVLIIEHNMDFILRQGVDRIVVMNEGEILMVGTPDEVRSNRAVIEAYLGAAGDESEEGGEEE